MNRKKYLIVMAAGHGTRMHSELPKQFLDLAGIPVLRRTITKFIDAYPDITVITVLPVDGDYEQWWRDYCAQSDFMCPQMIIRGGITRFHSVRAALEKVPDGALVAIHDGVRPMLSEGMIKSMFSVISEDEDIRGLIPVIPMVDTLKILKPSAVQSESGHKLYSEQEEKHVDRSEIFGAQTPQIFRSEDIKKAYSQAYDMSFTDDASVASRYKIPLVYIEGERQNFKITMPEDLAMAKAMLNPDM